MRLICMHRSLQIHNVIEEKNAMDWESWGRGLVLSFAANYLIMGPWDATSSLAKINILVFITLGVLALMIKEEIAKPSHLY